jgi:hypothetical protein
MFKSPTLNKDSVTPTTAVRMEAVFESELCMPCKKYGAQVSCKLHGLPDKFPWELVLRQAVELWPTSDVSLACVSHEVGDKRPFQFLHVDAGCPSALRRLVFAFASWRVGWTKYSPERYFTVVLCFIYWLFLHFTFAKNCVATCLSAWKNLALAGHDLTQFGTNVH